MIEVLRLLGGTLVLRPYVFAFLLVFLVLSITHLGGLRTLVWLAVGYAVAWASEYSSIHNGFPYGLYHYLPERTRSLELWVAGVPFMDSLSYVFLSSVSFLMAVQMTSPVLARGLDVRPADTRARRGSPAVLFLGAFLFMMLDVVIDPAALQGDRWFLGRLYYYPEPGPYFGIPISNFAGWFLVGLAILFLMQRADRWLPDPARTRGRLSFPGQAWLVPGLYFGILAMNVSVAFWIGEAQMGWTGVALSATLAVFHAVAFLHPTRRASPEERAAHLTEVGPGWARRNYGAEEGGAVAN